MHRTRALVVTLSVLLCACPERTAVWVGKGSTADSLTLVLGKWRGKESHLSTFLRVDRCGYSWMEDHEDRALWKGYVVGSRVVYGDASDAADMRGAPALGPGCYHVTTSGTGDVAFTVDSLGRVTQFDSLPGVGRTVITRARTCGDPKPQAASAPRGDHAGPTAPAGSWP